MNKQLPFKWDKEKEKTLRLLYPMASTQRIARILWCREKEIVERAKYLHL